MPRGMIETLRTGIGAGGQHADERVPGLVVGRAQAVVLRHHHAPLDAEHDLLDGVREVGHLDALVAAARGQQRGLVDEVGEVGAHHAGRRRGDRAEVDLGRERHRARVHLRISRRPCRSGGCTTTRRSKRPGPQQRLVEDVGPVRRREDDDAAVRAEAVHLGEDLVERLLALVVPARGWRRRRARRPMASSSSMNTIAGCALPWPARRGRARARRRRPRSSRRTRSRWPRRTARRPRPRRRARAASCPFPAGRESSTPRGILPPSAAYFSGFLRKSTISTSSCSASSIPATSSNVTRSAPS